MDAIGMRIRALREKRGWSMRELCRRTGISYATMWRIEHDKGKHAMQSIQAIAAALEVGTEALFGPVLAPANPSTVVVEPAQHKALQQEMSQLSRRLEELEADSRLEPELRHAIEVLKSLPAKERKRMAKMILYMTGATNMDNNNFTNQGPNPNAPQA